MPKIVPCTFPTAPSNGLAFIGEAPGLEETIKGRPLVGPSGVTFDAALRTANIDRAACFVGNVFEEQAPDNDVGPWMTNPSRASDARRRLNAELMAFGPSCIVPLGATALWAFTGHGGIKDYRGAVQPATMILDRAKLLPTYHPEAVRRDWTLLVTMVGDFIKAADEAARGPGITYPDVELMINPGFLDVGVFMAECLETSMLSVDIETGWGQITRIGFNPAPFKRAMCIPFVDFRKPNRSYWDSDQEAAVWEGIDTLMRSPMPKLGQNFPYDAFWLWDMCAIPSMNYGEDTRLMHHAMFPELEKSLVYMGARYTRLGAWKQWGGNASKEKRDDQ